MFHTASAYQVTQEILSADAILCHRSDPSSKYRPTPVNHLHAVPSANAEFKTKSLSALVYRNTLDLHQVVDQSVSQAPSVPWTKLASINDVSTLALDHAPHLLNAESSITLQSVLALQVKLAIHSGTVNLSEAHHLQL